MGEVFKVASECHVSKPMNTVSVHVNVDCAEIDVAIEKANRLVELLREASTLIDSLAARAKSEA